MDRGLVVDPQVGSTRETTIAVTDDDIGADVLVSWSQTDGTALPNGLRITEGDSYTIKVSLASVASANVTIPLGITPLTAGAADYTMPTSVTIPSGQSSATFDVEALIDELLEDNELVDVTLCSTASCPAGCASGDKPPLTFLFLRDPGVIADFSNIINVVTNEDDTTDLTYLPGQEGGEVTLGVKLTVDPVMDATITHKVVDGTKTGGTQFLPDLINGAATEFVAVDTDPDTAGLQSTLTFTGGNSGNWNTEQSFTLHFLYDDDVTNEFTEAGEEGDRYTIGFLNQAASGPYKAQTNNGELYVGHTHFSVADAGNAVVVSPDEVTVAASGAVEYDVQLASDPGGTVVVTPTSSDTAKATVSSALTFTTSNWNTPQQITVTGVGAGTTTITHAVTTATTAYPVSMTIEDVDVTITAPALPTLKVEIPTVTEGETGVITLTLSEAASHSIDITVSESAIVCGTIITCPQGTAAAGPVTFPESPRRLPSLPARRPRPFPSPRPTTARPSRPRCSRWTLAVSPPPKHPSIPARRPTVLISGAHIGSSASRTTTIRRTRISRLPRNFSGDGGNGCHFHGDGDAGAHCGDDGLGGGDGGHQRRPGFRGVGQRDHAHGEYPGFG